MVKNLFVSTPGCKGNGLLSKLGQRDAFPSRYISEIESDPPGDLSSAWSVLRDLDLGGVASEFDCQVVKYICQCVSTQAAMLAAAGVTALLNKMRRPRVTIGMDGSLYKFHPYFQQRMELKIRDLVDPSIMFQLTLSEDGSGRGAALAAAVTAEEGR